MDTLEFEEWVQIGDLHQDTLGHNGSSMVRKIKWLGKDFALKELTQSSTTAQTKEAIIFATNQHPHGVQLMCQWNKRTEYFITYMLMEKMDGDSSKLMNQRKAQDIVPPFSLLESVDIMFQVPKPMCFLHREEVAHHGLKNQNILWKHRQSYPCVVKRLDFEKFRHTITDFTASTMNYLDLSLVVIFEVKFLVSQQILFDWSSPKIFLCLNKLQCEHLASKLKETQAYL